MSEHKRIMPEGLDVGMTVAFAINKVKEEKGEDAE